MRRAEGGAEGDQEGGDEGEEEDDEGGKRTNNTDTNKTNTKLSCLTSHNNKPVTNDKKRKKKRRCCLFRRRRRMVDKAVQTEEHRPNTITNPQPTVADQTRIPDPFQDPEYHSRSYPTPYHTPGQSSEVPRGSKSPGGYPKKSFTPAYRDAPVRRSPLSKSDPVKPSRFEDWKGADGMENDNVKWRNEKQDWSDHKEDWNAETDDWDEQDWYKKTRSWKDEVEWSRKEGDRMQDWKALDRKENWKVVPVEGQDWKKALEENEIWNDIPTEGQDLKALDQDKQNWNVPLEQDWDALELDKRDISLKGPEWNKPKRTVVWNHARGWKMNPEWKGEYPEYRKQKWVESYDLDYEKGRKYGHEPRTNRRGGGPNAKSAQLARKKHTQHEDMIEFEFCISLLLIFLAGLAYLYVHSNLTCISQPCTSDPQNKSIIDQFNVILLFIAAGSIISQVKGIYLPTEIVIFFVLLLMNFCLVDMTDCFLQWSSAWIPALALPLLVLSNFVLYREAMQTL